MKTDQKAIRGKRRTLRHLATDIAGNSMLIMAAAMIPIIGIVGSAFDIARAYMVKTRLQQACDAGALAGRRSMTMSSFDNDTAAKQQANNFFYFNFPKGSFGTDEKSLKFSPIGTSDGQVKATAGVNVPMTLMRLFDTPAVDLEVECQAKLEIANTDIMFVLDVTGSMNCPVGTSGSCNGLETSKSKIVALRSAVLDFYDTMDGAISNEARLRFGFVPYSNTVNVGGLLPDNYIADSGEYQTRVGNFNAIDYLGTDSSPVVTQETYSSNISKSNCTRYANNTYPSSGNNPVVSGSAPSNRTTTTYSNPVWTQVGTKDSGTCKRTKTIVTTSYVTRYKFDGTWTYKKETLDTSGYKMRGPVPIATGLSTSSSIVPIKGAHNMVALAKMADASGISTSSSTWEGCIIERSSKDLDIDYIPDSDATRWRPMWPDLWWRRPGSSAAGPTTNSGGGDTDYTYFHPTSSSSYDDRSYVGCPKASAELNVMTRIQIENYLKAANGFKAIGGTYHDFGMIWGARLISPTGIFASKNATAENGKPISRHIIFMTDGEMSPHESVYGMYGTERLDQRIGNGSTNSNTLTNLHNARFAQICNAIKAKNISIWVVAYAQSVTTPLSECADPGKSFEAKNDQQLKDKFKQIASKIAELRLSQ